MSTQTRFLSVEAPYCRVIENSRACKRLKANHVLAQAGKKLVTPRPAADDRWQKHCLLRRQLQVAVREEHFSLAAALKRHMAEMRSSMSPAQQFVSHKLQELDFGTQQEKLAALAAVGEVGGMDILGEVAEYLKDSSLETHAARALYSIWHRPPNNDPQIAGLMNHGCQLLMVQEQLAGQPSGGDVVKAVQDIFTSAEEVFSKIIQLEPAFAEGWNKRATCRFYMGSFEDSIHDCKITLGLNSYHFGAMVGQGFCHMRLHDYRPAAASFQQALQIHPGLTGIRKYLEVLEQGAQQQEDEDQSNPSS